MCCAASIAFRKLGNWQMPTSFRGLIGCSASSIAAEKASVPSDPTRTRPTFFCPAEARHGRQPLEVVAADAAKLRGEPRGDLLGFGHTQGAQPLDQLNNDSRH